MNFLDNPIVETVLPLSDFHLQITLTTGMVMKLDISNLIQKKEKYWRLRQERYFKKVRIDPLGAICWPEGEDIAPESLLQYMVESIAHTTNS